MKKIIASVIILTAISCGKKENVNLSEKVEHNATETKEDKIPLMELNENQISEIVAPKQNDTIYVTNFFATWCGPCVREMPHFVEKMEELKNDKVKFTFISLDSPKDWETKVKDFATKFGLSKNMVLLSQENISPDFFSKNFKTWNGSSIPFTLISKGEQSDETIGMMDKETLTNKINNLK